ncbi:MAG: alpha/beta hydrolase [Myxococcota bacterium]|nr:alpha/beta hydrolase [Myxococcota bacterium]MDP7301245.1 alpha/beta hydrolase [Myxococcota bacterium]MDP7431541.1 alpha/beta hydrolase [Myxococcota bacterium]
MRSLAAFLLVAAAALPVVPAAASGGVQRDVALEGGGSLDYFPPFGSEAQTPLVVFVAESFWGLRAGQTLPLEDLVVRPLRSEGLAVAVLRHRPAPQSDPRRYAQDVAEGLAWLFGQSEGLGFDPERVVLAGHGSGGQLAALVALDPDYLAAHGLAPARLAGVFPMSALYDLEGSPDVPPELLAFAAQAYPDAAARRAGSPLTHAGGEAPPVLALAATGDMPGLGSGGLAFTEALRAAGHPNAETFIAPRRDHRSILDFSARINAARDHLIAFAGVGPRVAEMQELWAVRRFWRSPDETSEAFWHAGVPIERHEKTPEFDAWLRAYLALSGSRKTHVARESFHSIDLFAWLDALGPKAGDGRWLVTTNARGAQAVLDLEALRPYRPVVVIGIDEERNLFRLVELYHTLRRTSWNQPEPERWLLARPLGAFLYFLDPVPPELVPSLFGLFVLTPESFRRTESDPLAPVRALEPALAQLVTAEKACVACHTFHGVGGRAGHLRARDAAVVGGYGQALEEYPPKVWRRYVFEQADVAAEIGATQVILAPEAQQLLFRAVETAR